MKKDFEVSKAEAEFVHERVRGQAESGELHDIALSLLFLPFFILSLVSSYLNLDKKNHLQPTEDAFSLLLADLLFV